MEARRIRKVDRIILIRIGTLFSGIGGFDCAFERAGAEIAWQVERDAACLRVLGRHWPDAPKYDDVLTVGKHNLSPVDVICAGWPCQDLSVAGLRGGLAAERSGLFYEFARIANELRPSFLVWENVPGLLSSDNGRDFARVLHELDKIGYCGAWTMLDSRFFGVAQRRQRIFGVFALKHIGASRCAEILSLPSRVRWNPEKGGKKRTELARDIAASLRGRADGEGGKLDAETGIVTVGTISGGAHPGGHNGQDDSQVLEIAKTLTNSKNGRLKHSTETFALGAIADYQDSLRTLRATGGDIGGGSECLAIVRAHGRAHYTEDEAAGPDRSSGAKQSDVDLVIAATLNSGGNSGGFRTEPGEHLVFDWQSGGEVRLNISDKHSSAPQANQTPAVSMQNQLETLGLQGYNNPYGKTSEANAGKILSALRKEIGEKAFTEWGLGSLIPFQSPQILQSDLFCKGQRRAEKRNSGMDDGTLPRPEEMPARALCEMSDAECPGCSSQGWQLEKQFAGQFRAYLSELSQQGTRSTQYLHDLWIAGEGIGVLREALSAIQKVRGSKPSQSQSAQSSASVRRLTPREAERLQGYEDDWTRWGDDDREICDSARYKMIGNAVTVNVVEWIARRLVARATGLISVYISESMG